MPTAFISLGSNVGDRAGNLLLAIRGMLNAGLDVVRLSKIYETSPVQTFPQSPFLNMVAELGGKLPEPDQLLARLLRIEYALGRRREVEKGPRTIDLDLLLYSDQVVDTDLLKLPHPRLHQRRFVLVPLAEVAPDFVHPVFNKSIKQLLMTVNDEGSVELWQSHDSANHALEL